MFIQPTHVAAEQPLLDTDQFAELCDLVGSEKTEDLLRVFLSDLAERLPAIVSHCEARRGDEAKRSVHGLKGAALSIGARRLAMIAANIERAGDEGRCALCPELAACAAATQGLIEALLLQD